MAVIPAFIDCVFMLLAICIVPITLLMMSVMVFQVYKTSLCIRIQFILFHNVGGGIFKSVHVCLYLSSGVLR